MKLLIIIPIFMQLLVDQVISDCIHVITSYYNCKLYSVYSPIPNKSGSYYTFKNESDDAFYKKTLGKIDTFPKAMDHFRSIYNEIRSCKESWCNCTLEHILDNHNYTFFFNSSTFYSQMVSILNTVKNNYVQKSREEFDSYDMYYYFGESYLDFPFLSDFCYKYEFTYKMFSFNDETLECESVAFEAFVNCLNSYLMLELYLGGTKNLFTLSNQTQNFASFQTEQFFSCLSTYMPQKTCPQDIKRAVLLSYVYYYPFVIKGSNLTMFIDSVASKKAPIKKHVYISQEKVTSLKKYDEKCSFANKSYVLFDSSWLKINGTLMKSKYDGYNVEKASIQFIYNKNLSRTYSLSVTSFPSAFDSKKTTTIQASNNQKWLELFAIPDNYKTSNHSSITVLIYDYIRNATVILHDCYSSCYVDLVASNEMFANSTGLFVTGCSGAI